MIHSQSGLIEQDCVFSTPYDNYTETFWQVTQHDNTRFLIEFLRITPGENIVKINPDHSSEINNLINSCP